MAFDLTRITLTVGSHRTRDSGVSLMEAVAWWAGEKHSDAPRCVSGVLATYGTALNDVLPDHLRQQLVPLIPAMVGTAGDGLDGARGYMALDWLVRVSAPAWLELAGLSDSAARLRELEPITNLWAAEPAVLEARRAAYVAWAAAGTAGATGNDAGDAARDAARAAAGDAARVAARVATGNAAEEVAREAAGAAAWAARVAAGNAAGDDENSAREALSPTVADLQARALDLLRRMICP